jgi:hypothetical protein
MYNTIAAATAFTRLATAGNVRVLEHLSVLQ